MHRTCLCVSLVQFYKIICGFIKIEIALFWAYCLHHFLHAQHYVINIEHWGFKI